MPHNFFDLQPIQDADIYLLRMILHDWPDTEATTILGNHVPALKKTPGSRLLIMDTVLPSAGTAPVHEEALMRYRDLTMMQMYNSRERELEDWKGLCRQVDGRLGIKSVVNPFGSVMSVLEVVYDGSSDLANDDEAPTTLNGLS